MLRRPLRRGTGLPGHFDAVIGLAHAVPAGQYGVAANELLRLDCNTGRPLGVVPR